MRKKSSATVNPKAVVPIALIAMLLAAVPVGAVAEPDLARAKETFDQMCAGCHGTSGNGQEGTKSGFVPRVGTLANKAYMASVPDDFLVLIIQKGGAYMGKIASMPAWEKKLSEQEIRDIVAHIRTF
jgi:mono/diheme cytochrome c family protein